MKTLGNCEIESPRTGRGVQGESVRVKGRLQNHPPPPLFPQFKVSSAIPVTAYKNEQNNYHACAFYVVCRARFVFLC